MARLAGPRFPANIAMSATPMAAMEKPYPSEINHTNFFQPMELTTSPTPNRIQNCIPCLQTLVANSMRPLLK